MASTFQLKSSSYQGRYLQLDCTQEKSISTNRSVIHWTLKTVGQDGTYYTTGPTTVKINGEQVFYKARKSWNSEEFPAAPGSVSGTASVSHDNTGKATISVELSTAIYTSTVTKKSGTWTLDDIPRAATLTAAPHFTDEDNPVITYSNPAGNAVTSLKACIANSAGTVVYAEYRDIPMTGSTYTFDLTVEERNALRWATINSPNLAVKFYVTTVIGGQTFYSTQDKIMTIANANPLVDVVIEDRGGTSRALTGSPDRIIKGFNYVVATIDATPLKGASIKEIKTTNGNNVVTGTEAVFDNTESAVFDIVATDSRGYSTPVTITKELIDYVKLTSHLEATNPTTSGTATLDIKGNYFNGSFGAVGNTLSVQFRYKENDGAYSEWLDANYTLSGNSYSATVELPGLDYRKAYTVQARAVDKIQPVETKEKVIKSLTVFDWGENDFKFNVDVFDKDGGRIGTEVAANDYDAYMLSGKALLESGWVTITPVANSPTAVYVAFKRHYNKIPTVLVTPSSGVIGTQLLGASTNGTTKDGVNIVCTRVNTVPTTIYYYVFGEVEV
jgi:hypothetical protein